MSSKYFTNINEKCPRYIQILPVFAISTFRFVKKLCVAWIKHCHKDLPALKRQGNMGYEEKHHFFNIFESKRKWLRDILR